jgi:sugar lactone lactonase YvrE
MAVDPSGNVYVVDNTTNLIDVFYPNGTTYTHLGMGHLTDPAAVAVDGNGVVYVTDEVQSLYTSGQTQYQVEVFNSLGASNPGAYDTSWGTSASGTGNIVPVGISANSAGSSICVADQNLEQIQVFSGAGTPLAHWGQAGITGNGTFAYPVGVAQDSAGNVYVADWGTDLVQVFTPNGTWLRQWNVTQGTELLAAQSIAVYQNCLVYVTDGFGSVGTFDIYGNLQGSVEQAGSTNLIQTEGVAVAPSGAWYVADAGNDQVYAFNACLSCQAFTPTPTFTPTWTYTPTWTGTPTFTNTPNSFSPTWTFTFTWTNTPTPTPTWTFTPAPTSCNACETATFQYGTGVAGSSVSQMNANCAVVLNSAGTSLIVADEQNRRVDVFPLGSGMAQTFNGVDSVKNPGGLAYPIGVGADGNGNIYVADYNGNQVIEMSGTGTVLAAYRTGLNQPTDVALDSQGNIYILDLTQITKLGPGFTGPVAQFGSGSVSGASGICVRGTDVFVADKRDQRVDWWTNLGAGTFSVPYNLPGAWNPSAVAFDATGRYAYVSEESSQLEVFDTTGGVWNKVAVCLNGNWKQPDGVAVDGNGNYYISDNLNSRVQQFGPIPCLPTPITSPINTNTNTMTNTFTNTPTITTTWTPTCSKTWTPTVTATWTTTVSKTWTPSVTSTSTSINTMTVTSSFTSTPDPSDTPSNTPTATPTDSPTVTATSCLTATPDPSDTPTNSPTNTMTLMSSFTPTPDPSDTPTSTSTYTLTFTSTIPPTITSTWTPTVTTTWTSTVTNSTTMTQTFTLTPTPTSTPTQTSTMTWTTTIPPTITMTWTPTVTSSFTMTQTFTLTPTPTYTSTMTWTLTVTRTYTPSVTQTYTTSATKTITMTATRTYTTTITPTVTRTTTPTVTKTITMTGTRTFTSTKTPTANTPTKTKTYTFTFTPSLTPTITKTPTNTFTFTPTPTPMLTFYPTPFRSIIVSDSASGCVTVGQSISVTAIFGPTNEQNQTDDYSIGFGNATTIVWKNGCTVSYNTGSLPSSKPVTVVQSVTVPATVTSGSYTTLDVVGIQDSTYLCGGSTILGSTSISMCSSGGNNNASESLVLEGTATSNENTSRAPVVAAPNISRDEKPIKFLVNLDQPAEMVLTLYSLSGERIYSANAQGTSGLNALVWDLANNQNQPVASGLYIYVLQTTGGGKTENHMGKVVVIH